MWIALHKGPAARDIDKEMALTAAIVNSKGNAGIIVDPFWEARDL
jgi:hypothetical protein